MFYESRTHELLQVSSPLEAAQKIKNHDVSGYQVLAYQIDGSTYLAVNDAHIDDSNFAETAVLKQLEDGTYLQIESITAAWIKTAEQLAQYFADAAKEPCLPHKANIIIGKPKGNETAYFTCGCCGEGFRGNVKAQLEFDQDAGYGICPNCEQYYR